VVSLLGEARGGVRHELIATILAPLRQSLGHGRTVRSLDRPVKNAAR
jgi:hypothetical protein